MATTAAPFGLRPVKKLGAGYNSTGQTQLRISSTYATSIFYGDVVKIDGTTGTVQKDTGTDACTPVGVFLGCEYVNSTGQLIHSQYWPASTVSTEAWAYVEADPDTVYLAQSSGSLSTADIGGNAALVQTAGTTTMGRSKVAVNSSGVATTNSLPVRIVGIAEGPFNASGDTYTEVLVKFNTHQYNNTSGV